MTPRITIAWDVDDVLNDLGRAWVERRFPIDFPGRAARYEDLVANPPHEALGVPRAAYLASLDAFRAEAQEALAPAPEVLAWLRERGENHRHIAITATPLANAHRSASWVVRHFGAWIRTFSFVPSPRDDRPVPVYDATKLEMLAPHAGRVVLVDDTPKNLEGAAERGVRGVLVPRPWNARSGGIDDALADLDAALADLERSR